jgi:antirestriction protein
METITDDVAAIIDGSSVPREALLLFADNQHLYPADIDEDMVADAEDNYLGGARSTTEWAERWAEDTGMLDGIPEDLRNYFDHAAWFRDGCLNGDIYPLREESGYVHVFHS